MDYFAKEMNTTAAMKLVYNIDKIRKQMRDLKKVNQKGSAISLMPFEVISVGDGDGLAFPYVHKTIDSDVYLLGKLKVHVNKKTAKKLKISQGSCIDITSPRGTVEGLSVHITDTIADDVIAIPLGFGHRGYTKYACGKGVNPKEIMSAEIDPLSGSAHWWITKVKIS